MDARPHSAETASGTCAKERAAVERECTAAATARQAADDAGRELREARRELSEALGLAERSEAEADRRTLADAKTRAQRRYREAVQAATSETGRREATAAWMHEIDRLNRGLRRAAATLGRARRRAAEAQQRVDSAMQLSNVRRIAAEAAASRCLDARHALASCEESAIPVPADGASPASPASPASFGAAPGGASAPGGPSARPPGIPPSGVPAIVRLLRGDREVLRQVADELAEVTGRDGSTFQLMLVDLIDGIVARAREEGALRFPERHPFWRQFTRQEAHALAEALARMGYRFDGDRGWLADRVPSQRDLAVALAHVGSDLRALRQVPSPSDMESLFEGASVAAEEYLMREAPRLGIDELGALLGPRAERLGQLWDEWGRLRPLLVRRLPEAAGGTG